MESIAALSFAVNIIQVVVWGQQTATFCLRVYRNEEIDPALTETLQNFRNATQSLQDSLSQNRLSTEEKGLLEIAQKCGHTAGKLLKEVGPVSTSHKKRNLIKAFFKQTSINKLKEELAACQVVLETQQLLDLRRKHDLTAIKLDDGFDHLGEDIQNLVLGLESGKTRLAEILMNQHEVTRRLEDINLGVTNFQRTSDHRAVLASLFFPELLHRTERIEMTHPKTYEWALKTPEELSKKSGHFTTPSWPNLHQWLESQDSIYWVCGKPGAGKSTFMKYVIEHTRTKRAIAAWSGSKESIIASYFFWSQGSALQKSMEGLLRTILFQILETRPELTAFCGLDPAVGIFAWTKDRLLHSLESIISQTNVPLTLCLFVDGLDESMDDQIQVIKLLRQVSSNPNVKCVVSSRPLRVFHTALGSCPQIHLQELTAKDIDEYVSSKLRAIDYPHQPVPMTWYQKLKLIDGIRNKADGVFLWVSLATASIIAGIFNGDSFDELQSRIEELPSELNGLYSNILSSIELRYRIQAMRYFRLLLLKSSYSELKLSVLILSLVDLGMKDPPQESNSEGEEHFEAVMNGCNRTFLHLQQRCGMLLHLEFDHDPYKDNQETWNKLPPQLHSLRECETLRVQFVHRTIYDFFRETPSALEVGLNELCLPWNPLTAYTAGFIRRASILEPGVIKSTAVADFDANVAHIATAIAAIRDAEISSGIPQDDLLARLDRVGRRLFQHIRQQCGFETDLHWCILLSPHFDDFGDDFVGSGNMASLLELCATAGLVHIVKAKIPQLAAEECTSLLNCALNGLLYLRDGEFLQSKWFCYDASLLDTERDSGPAQFENFKARVALILALLEAGADPNAKARCILRLSKNNEHRPGTYDIQEQTLLGQTAWTHFLRMLMSNFYYANRATKEWQNLNTLPFWTEMIARFLESGANPNEVVQNVCINIAIDVDRVSDFPETMGVQVQGAAYASTIIKEYFQKHACSRSILEKLGNEEPSEGTKFDKLIMYAERSLREVFYKLFDLPDPSLLEVGQSWDISSGIIDHLGPMILGLHQPLWIDSNSDNPPPILNTLRTVLSLLEGMKPRARVNYKVSRRLPKQDPIPRTYYNTGSLIRCNYRRPSTQRGLQGMRNAPSIRFDT